MSAAATLRGHGVRVALPARWEGRIYRRPEPGADPALGGALGITDPVHPSALGSPGERTYSVTHLATFPLPPGRGDFGTGAVERMDVTDVFLSLLEFGPDCDDTALFAPQGLPRPTADDFSPNALQRRLLGQSGFQHFCTVSGRPLCVYVVLGSHSRRHRLVPRLHEALAGVEFDHLEVAT